MHPQLRAPQLHANMGQFASRRDRATTCIPAQLIRGRLSSRFLWSIGCSPQEIHQRERDSSVACPDRCSPFLASSPRPTALRTRSKAFPPPIGNSQSARARARDKNARDTAGVANRNGRRPSPSNKRKQGHAEAPSTVHGARQPTPHPLPPMPIQPANHPRNRHRHPASHNALAPPPPRLSALPSQRRIFRGYRPEASWARPSRPARKISIFPRYLPTTATTKPEGLQVAAATTKSRPRLTKDRKAGRRGQRTGTGRTFEG